MLYSFQLFIAVFSPSIALRLFGEVVLPGGGECYEVSKNDGAYLLRSKYITEWENDRIFEQTGMNLRTCVTSFVIRPTEVEIDDMIKRLIYRIGSETSHDLLLLENAADIIMMQKNYDIVVNENAVRRFDFDNYNFAYQVHQLPKLNLKEENPNGNNMDNRN